MNMRILFAAAAVLVATASASHAVTITGTVTENPTASNPAYTPQINDHGEPYVGPSVSLPLPFGVTTTPTTFMQVAPISGSASVGTVTGNIAVALTLSDGSAVTGVTSTGNVATLAGGVVTVKAYYELFYGNQTDCITWSGTTCSATDNTTTIGDTLALSFADGNVLDINFYNWSDWTMSPNVSFELFDGPTTVPEPPSLALLASFLAAIGFVVAGPLRRRHG